MEPASIRYKNPGAMWGGNAITKKWGELGHVTLHDGLGQGNQIAVFPTYVAGICAQIDLWRTPRYHNKRFADAIAIWSGGNWVSSYIKFVTDRVPGMTGDTIMSDDFLKSSQGLAFLKAQAWHEAGRPYPAADSDFAMAQRMVFSMPPPKVANNPKPKTAVVVATTAAGGTVVAAQAVSHSSGLMWLAIIAGLAVVGFAAWWFFFRHERGPLTIANPTPTSDNTVVPPSIPKNGGSA